MRECIIEIVIRKGEDRLITTVKEPAQGNQVNDRILEIIREMLPNSVIRLIKGHHSSHKVVSIGNR